LTPIGRHNSAELFGRLVEPACRHDPYPVYAEILRQGPLWIDRVPAAVIGGYRDCEALLRDPRLSAERWRYAGSMPSSGAIPYDAPTSLWQPSFLTLDPPDHDRMRRLVSKAFNANTIARLEGNIRALVDQLMDRAAQGDVFDVVSGLAYPLSVTVICRLLGIPEQEEYLFHGWSSQLALFVDGLVLAAAGSERTHDWLPATIEMHRYIGELVTQRKDTPGDDLITALLAIQDAGDTITTDELVATIVLLLVTGHETRPSHTRPQPGHQVVRPRRVPPQAQPRVAETLPGDPPPHHDRRQRAPNRSHTTRRPWTRGASTPRRTGQAIARPTTTGHRSGRRTRHGGRRRRETLVRRPPTAGSARHPPATGSAGGRRASRRRRGRGSHGCRWWGRRRRATGRPGRLAGSRPGRRAGTPAPVRRWRR
jgi:hypothetical protein